MTHDDRSTSARHNDLIWPAAIVGISVIAALVVIIVTGHNTDDLVRSIGALFSVTGTAAGVGAWVRSTQAAKQTNGDLDARIKTGVQQGITLALQQAQKPAAAPAVPGRRRRPAGDPPTEQLPAPKL